LYKDKYLELTKPDDFIIATGTTCKLEQFIVSVFETLGLNWKNHLETDKKYLRPADIEIVKANPIKAQKKLNWKAEFTACDVARLMVEAELKTKPVKL